MIDIIVPKLTNLKRIATIDSNTSGLENNIPNRLANIAHIIALKIALKQGILRPMNKILTIGTVGLGERRPIRNHLVCKQFLATRVSVTRIGPRILPVYRLLISFGDRMSESERELIAVSRSVPTRPRRRRDSVREQV